MGSTGSPLSPEGFAWVYEALGDDAGAPPQLPPQPVHTGPKVGRNDPCPCGSGKKYKYCHGKLS